MKAVVLAAGYATRLHPYTENYPKALLKIAGKPMLDFLMDKLESMPDVDSIYLVTNSWFFELFNNWCEGRDSASSLEIIDDGTATNESRLGSIGDLHYTIEQKEISDDLLVVCSDKMFTFSLAELVRCFKSRGEVVNAVSDIGDKRRVKGLYGCVILGPENRILEYREKPQKPKSSLRSVTFYVYPKKTIPLIAEYARGATRADAPGYFSEWLSRRAPMYAWFMNGECYDAGNPQSYAAVQRKFGTGPVDVKVLLLPPGPSGQGVLADIEFVIEGLSRWAAVSLVYVGVRESWLAGYGRWVGDHPSPLPICIRKSETRGHANSAENMALIKKTGCTVVVSLDSHIRDFQFDPERLNELVGQGNLLKIEKGLISPLAG